MYLKNPLRRPYRLSAKNLPLKLVLIGLLILALALLAWLLSMRNNPQRVFMEMLENNLRTTSVTRHLSQTGGSQEVDQKVRLLTGHQQLAVGRTELRQTGNGSARVVTENIGTPRQDFIRYAEIETSQTNPRGQALDFADVLNVWAETSQASGEGTNGELYSEMVLGLIPFANLDYQARARLMNIIRENQVYQIKATPQKVNINGRSTLVYQVAAQPEGYVTLLKQLGQELGLSQLVELDPAAYAEAQPFEFSISVDIAAQRLVSLQHADGRVEQYGGYGIRHSVEPPRQTIPLEDLQGRIQAASQ